MTGSALELDDIQSGVLRPRPSPYAATYLLFSIDERGGGTGVNAETPRRRRDGGSPNDSGG
jgi:hypothetical protein